MPIRIPYSLPATETLTRENIFVMDERRASSQDIRPLRIAILNLMPTKIVTETQLLRLLSNTPLQVDVCLMTPETHCSKNTPEEHLNSFYTKFSSIKNEKFDGMDDSRLRLHIVSVGGAFRERSFQGAAHIRQKFAP